MAVPFLLHGLNAEQSVLVLWRLLFSPFLRVQIGLDASLAWCEELIEIHLTRTPATFVREYERMAVRVDAVTKDLPRPSLARPPWAMISLDLYLGLIPWLTPSFGNILQMALSRGMAVDMPLGTVCAVAFMLHGGPGDTKETAIRITAPDQGARASAEHWLMRAYLRRRKNGWHATLAPDADSRRFSTHRYIDQDGAEKDIYFETTASFGREKEDFLDFLRGTLEKEHATAGER